MGIDLSGFDDVAMELRKLGEDAKTAKKAMLTAGSNEIVEAWQQAISDFGLIDTGAMLASVAPSMHTDYAEIYPQGVDARGTSNAEKAFIAHYGRTHQAATHFVDAADEAGGDNAVEAMTEIWDEFIETGSVPSVQEKWSAPEPGAKSRKKRSKKRRT